VIHPDSELRFVDGTIGYGLLATSLIPHGTLTWVRDDLDQIVDPAADVALPPMLAALVHKYSYLEPRGRVLCWDHGRFVNHSCDPNCCSTGFDFEIAVRDIQPGEQITDDYGSLNVDYEFECRCGSPRCRGTIRATDITRFADDWDRDAAAAVERAGSVPPPLWPLLTEQADVERALRGEVLLPSCRAHALPEFL
jgi:uncharacterized protein